MTESRIEISQPSVGEDEWLAMREPISNGWLTQGRLVARFENEFAQRHQAPFAIATTSCTTGLHLMLLAAGIGPGDEVIVPAFTWVSTANAVLYVGAKVVFADIDPETFNLDIQHTLSRVTSRTKAVIAVHLFGLCADVISLKRALPNGILLFEDAACAAGASINGQSAGSLGDAGVFSFHPRKAITTGEGGMLTTREQSMATLAIEMRNHGASIPEETRHSSVRPFMLPDFEVLGYNYRMTDIQAAMGLVQLSKLDMFIQERDKWAKVYEEGLSHLDWVVTPKVPSGFVHSWQSYVLRIVGKDSTKKRDSLMEWLESHGIASRPGTQAVHLLGYYRRVISAVGSELSGTEKCASTAISIPMHNRLSSSDVERVIRAILDFAKRF